MSDCEAQPHHLTSVQQLRFHLTHSAPRHPINILRFFGLVALEFKVGHAYAHVFVTDAKLEAINCMIRKVVARVLFPCMVPAPVGGLTERQRLYMYSKGGQPSASARL